MVTQPTPWAARYSPWPLLVNCWMWVRWPHSQKDKVPKSLGTGCSRQPFSCNMITPGLIPVWRPWSILSCHTHGIVWIWNILTSNCSGWWKMDSVDNVFLVKTPSQQLWNSESLPLVQLFTSMMCKHLFIIDENAQLMVMSILKNSVS